MKDKKLFRYSIISFLSGSLFLGIMLTVYQSISIQKNHVISNTESIEFNFPHENNAVDKININNANIEELMNLPGIGESKSKSIVNFREKYGPYEDIYELLYVPGINQNLLDSIQDMITIQ